MATSVCPLQKQRGSCGVFFTQIEAVMPGRLTRGTISGSNHGSRIAPSVTGWRLAHELAELGANPNTLEFPRLSRASEQFLKQISVI